MIISGQAALRGHSLAHWTQRQGHTHLLTEHRGHSLTEHRDNGRHSLTEHRDKDTHSLTEQRQGQTPTHWTETRTDTHPLTEQRQRQTLTHSLNRDKDRHSSTHWTQRQGQTLTHWTQRQGQTLTHSLTEHRQELKWASMLLPAGPAFNTKLTSATEFRQHCQSTSHLSCQHDGQLQQLKPVNAQTWHSEAPGERLRWCGRPTFFYDHVRFLDPSLLEAVFLLSPPPPFFPEPISLQRAPFFTTTSFIFPCKQTSD